MKTIVLGDTHGRAFWKQVVNIEKFDKLVFIGDYFDSFDLSAEEQIKNFQDIVAYKEANPKKVVLLIGNHDFHYTPIAAMYDDKYSGYQSKYAITIGHLLATHKNLLQMAYLQGEYLFTHAGVTNEWFNWAVGQDDHGWAPTYPVDEIINETYQTRPHLFLFRGNDPYGDDTTQSPIWVRPQSLNMDALPYTHVVGHTRMKRIATEAVDFREGGKGWFIDTLGTTGEYLVIEDDKAYPQSVHAKLTEK